MIKGATLVKILQEKHQKRENIEKKRGIIKMCQKLHLEELIVHSSCQAQKRDF